MAKNDLEELLDCFSESCLLLIIIKLLASVKILICLLPIFIGFILISISPKIEVLT